MIRRRRSLQLRHFHSSFEVSRFEGTLSSHESHSCIFDPAKFNDSLQNVPLVISATVLNVTADPKDNRLQAATVRVKRIFKGLNIINNRKKIVIHGLGNVQFKTGFVI
ncbi:hypothetical protein WUBG_11038 [Wuchereria bancrofti]|uniref:Uncharacterized protein n=1 Tax=Wuchereria bancrofti TaxID=6293 RepID=J9EM25_WUCBA|nr:hypothetical protein WUBG_11038 [Wuchereria bancrofti]